MEQRELLKAYAELIQKYYTNHFFDDAIEESLDQFLKYEMPHTLEADLNLEVKPTFEEWKEQNKITISKCGNKLADNDGYVFEEWELIDKYKENKTNV